MKHLQLFILLTFCSLIISAQADNEPSIEKSKDYPQRMETLTKSSNSHGIYIGLGGGYSNIGGNSIGQFHSRIAYVTNQTLEFGFEGQSYQGIKNIKGTDNVLLTAGGFGGLHFKYKIYGNKKIHIGLPVFLGVGALAKTEAVSGEFFNSFDADFESATPAFVIDPGVNIEFNINRFVGAEFGVRYRFADSFEIDDDAFNNLNGWIIGGTFKFGFFDFGGRKTKQNKQKLKNSDDTYNSY